MFLIDVYMYFFFFKQKTAYDIRISDWSSDVCSSDLIDQAGDGARQRGGVMRRNQQAIDLVRHYLATARHVGGDQRSRAGGGLDQRFRQIGRALCRERV